MYTHTHMYIDCDIGNGYVRKEEPLICVPTLKKLDKEQTKSKVSWRRDTDLTKKGNDYFSPVTMLSHSSYTHG